MLISVLLNARTATWKITDFGLTCEGTSGRAYTTHYSRGTNCYRAPELIDETEKRVVTMKSDIWALGCVMYELIAEKKAFPSEYNVFLFTSENRKIEVPELPLHVDRRFRSVIGVLLQHTLAKDWWVRPSARSVFECLRIFPSQTNMPPADKPLLYFSYPSDKAMFEKNDERWPYVQWKAIW